MRTLRLLWVLQRSSGRAGASVLAMAVACSAVSAALLLFVVGGYDALTGRAEATAWRSPVETSAADAAAVMAVHGSSVDGRPLTVVDLAALPGEDPGTPPGLPHVPEPGEVWVSPALAALSDELPAGRLADRLVPPGAGLHLAGEVDTASLVSPAELLAVVGRDAGDPLMDPEALQLTSTDGAPRFVDALPRSSADATSGGAWGGTELYRGLALCALALLVVPLTTLGAAAARLGVSRRDQRLAAMRLVGASSRQVTALTAVESLAASLAGVVVGTALHAAVLAPIGTQITLQQNTFAWSQIWPQGWHLAAVYGLVVVLAVLGAVLGLRRVRISPLGVSARVTPPGVKVVRAVVLVGVFVLWVAIGSQVFQVGLVAVAAATLVLFGAIALVGPWIVWLLGRLMVATSRSAAGVVAGRRVMDDPKGVWRTVGGLALVGFVAAGLSVFPALSDQVDGLERSTVRLDLPVGADAASAQRAVSGRLDAAGVPADVEVQDTWSVGPGETQPESVVVRVAGGEADVAQMDTAVTALTAAVPGTVVDSSADSVDQTAFVMDDIATGSLITLAVVFVVAAVSAGLGQASQVLDTRRQLQLLTLAGTPPRVLRAARRRQVLGPLLATLSVSVGLGLLFVLPFGAVALLTAPQGLLMLAVCLATGIAAVVLAVEASTPLLGRVSRRLPEAVG